MHNTRTTVAAPLIAIFAALSISAALPASAQAKPVAPGEQSNEQKCEDYRKMSNLASDRAAAEYAAGNIAESKKWSGIADTWYTHAVNLGCRWATWRVNGPGESPSNPPAVSPQP
ncbi:hypothetical protein ACFQZZ_05545 [Nocardia sp. GCM10030253]|uniref:hypothetical protein n=1 Tax=Nocardia sp. GCM10030253 TaxID=3273404 RepID=UPI00362D12A4